MKQTSDIAFAPDWLALREPADHAARDAQLLNAAAQTVPPGETVLDLGSGTGSTLRAFEAAGFTQFRWRLFDNDSNLLDRAKGQHPQAETVIGNLSKVDDIPLAGAHLVTTSALLDLMSADWIKALAQRLHAAKLPFYAALNYDGVMRWTPPRSDDDLITQHFNAHQQTDKGNGIALGPQSAQTAARIFEELGFAVSLAESPWVIGPEAAALHTQLVDGIATAVSKIDQTAGSQWGRARKAAAASAQAYIGHLDLLAIPR